MERVEGRVLLATFTVINTTDTTATGSLRWAIGQSNGTPGSNTIAFNIATSGVQTIVLTSALPAITVPVTIDGTTEPGYTTTPVIELDGAGAGANVDGLDIGAGTTTIKGLAINRFKGEGISLSVAGGDTIEDDFIGTNPAGTVAEGNGLDGVLVKVNSNGNTIFGNLISGNVNDGIYLNGQLFGATNPVTSANLIVGNAIGTDVTGTKALGNQNDGIAVQNATMTTVGGTTAMTRNLLSGNGTGIELFNNSDNSVVEGNYIGTDVTGEVALGNNASKGFFNDNLVFRGISNSTIGGTAAGSGNVISGGAHYGIDSFVIGSGNLTIEGNLIGTDATGTKALGNASGGLVIAGPSGVTVGGTVAGARNVISANGGDGLIGNTPGLVIQGNFIGTDITGAHPLGNTNSGISAGGQAGATIGGLAAGQGNLIAYNGAANNVSNVVVTATNTTILSNSIYGSGKLGIEVDESASNTQAAPVLTSAVSMNTTSTIVGTLTTTSGTYTLQFFASPTLNQAGNAEGQTLLGTATVLVVGGVANFSMVVPSGFTPGDFITATATSATGNTSAFSNGVTGSGTGNGLGPPTIAVSSSASTVAVGQDVTDTFTIANPFTADDGGVTFSDAIPAGATFVSGMTSSGVPVTLAAGVATAAIGTLAAGHSVTVTIVLLATPTAVPSFTNVGDVTATTPPIFAGTDTASATTAVTPVADVAVTIAGPTSPTMVGQNLTYVVTVTNNGPSPATGVDLSDTLPTAVSYVSATTSSGPLPVLGNGVVTVAYGALASGASFTLTIVVTAEAGTLPLATDAASVSATEPDPVLANNTASFSSVVTPIEADLSVGITGPSGPTMVGQNLTFVVTVANAGPSPATGVALADALPAGVTLVSARTSSGPQPVLSNGVLTVDYGNLDVAGMFTLTIVVTAGAGSAPLATDTASVAGNELDPNLNDNTASYGAMITPVADVAVALAASPNPVGVGQDLVYTVTVADVGPSPASGVILNDILPASVTLVSAVASSGPAPTEADGMVTDGIGMLDAGSLVVITITVVPTGSSTPLVMNGAGVLANETDPDMANNTASITTDVVPVADLAIQSETVSPGLGPIIEGNPVVITFVVANDGPSTATNVSLTDQLPAGLTFVSGTADGGVVTSSFGIVTAPVGTLTDGATSTVTILAATTAAGMSSDSASVTSDVSDPNPSNNNSSASFDVQAMSDLSVVLGATAGPVFTGDVLTYTAVVTNNGPSTATNVVFTDPLPAGVTFASIESNGVAGSESNGVATQVFASLAAGASETVVLMVVPTQPGTVFNAASVAGDEPDPNVLNDTSSAFTAVIKPQSLITFASPAYSVPENAGLAAITLVRSGYLEDSVSVFFTTGNFLGNATPGVDYQFTAATVIFPAGATEETVFVPVLDNPYDNHDEVVGLALEAPTGSATLVPNPTISSLTIMDIDPLLVGPVVTDLKLAGPVSSITEIEVDTTGHLDPSTAANPANYTLTATGGAGKAGLPFGTIVPVASAVYNPLTGAVYLFPATPLPGNEVFVVSVNGSRPGAVTDVAGNPLNSVFGVTPGSDYTLTVARGTNITYSNENGDPVTLKLTGPGTLDIDRYPAGDLERLQVVGGVANKTVITSSVHPGRPTKIGSILGLGQFGSIRLKMTTPPFYVANLPYPNLSTQFDTPAEDTLLPTPPAPPKTKSKPTPKVKARAIETPGEPASKKPAHVAGVEASAPILATHHAAKVPTPHAGHGR